MFEKLIDLSVIIKTKISVVILLPFWYLSLYLFNTDFYNSSDLILKVVTCFCISLPAESVFSYFFYLLMKKNGYETDNKLLIDASVFVLLLWLSLLIFLSYVLRLYTCYYMPFLYLILWFYLLPFLVFLLWQMGRLVKRL